MSGNTEPCKQLEEQHHGIDHSAFKAPFEEAFRKVITPFEQFTKNQIAGGLILMVCLVIALIFANTGMHHAYEHTIHTLMGFDLGDMHYEKTLHHWINDGLMAIFFLVVGLEIKREVMVGELSSLSKASLPVIAALGGMIVPAFLYFLTNGTGDASRGWGIPMATDIAFAVGVLALLGKRVPASVMTFLLALAIADDLGAVLVIGIFYTEQIYMTYLAIAAGLIVVLILFNAMGVRAITPYMLVGIMVWAAFLQSGIHATLAGVLVALTIPTRPKYHPKYFSEKIRCMLDHFDKNSVLQSKKTYGWSAFSNNEQAEIIEEIDMATTAVASPLRKLEHALHPMTAFLIIPIFALANAGVKIHFENFGSAITNPVTIGVMLGLVLGKLIGIAGSTWLAIKFNIGNLPSGANFKHIIGVGLMGGIGFTMSIFVTELAFPGMEEMLISAKTGILLASALAGILGYAWFRVFTSPQEATEDESNESFSNSSAELEFAESSPAR